MNIRRFAAITVLVLSSFAATNVAPTKAELESMYDKAFREFNANNFPQALKELDAIDARQPDLAESQNLRGVILMRQGEYDRAEGALQKALATDPKFWNARFNLAEIPFLRKDWAEARKRFDALLQGNAAELQGEAAQLIQYKILLTHLLQGNENMVDSILAKFELSPDTPAATYAHAAIALQNKKQKEATDLLAAAEKNFSPQLNKLFAESLYEVGWLQKPVGQTRAALELTSAADRAAKAKTLATEKYDLAEQAFQQLDLTAARKLVDEADAADPKQARTINLRGEILLAQKDFDGAENAFNQALKLDPKLSEAHYNLAQIPFKKKDYAKARDRFEALFNAAPASGGDKSQTSQILKFKIYLTLLLEGKDSRAQKMMEQFQFTGDTPALYYAQAAWEFKHDNTAKANLWIVSARKIYSPALNLVFSDSFYDLGWLQKQTAPPASTTTEVAKTDARSIEPSPIPATAVASNEPAKQPVEVTESKSPSTNAAVETTTKGVAQAPSTETLNSKNEKPATAADASRKAEVPVASNALPSETRAPIPREVPAKSTQLAQNQTKNPAAAPANKVAPPPPKISNAGTSAAVVAPKTVREWSKPSFIERMDQMTSSHTLLEGTLLLAATILLAWVVVSEVRRRVHGSSFQSPAPAVGPQFHAGEGRTMAEKVAAPARLAGGPPQISLQLRATEPSVRRSAVPLGKGNRAFGPVGTIAPPGTEVVPESFVPREIAHVREPEPFNAPMPESVIESAPVDDLQHARDFTPAPSAAVAKLESAPEWEFAPRKDVGPGAMEAPAEFEPSVAFDTPIAFESPAPVEARGESAPFQALSRTIPIVETPSESAPAEAHMEPAPVVENLMESAQVGAADETAPDEPLSEVGPVQVVDESASVEAHQEAAPVEALKEPAPVIENLMEGAPAEAVDESAPVEALNEVEPAQVVDESASVEAHKEAAPVENITEAGSVEAISDAEPVEAVEQAAPVEALDEVESVEEVIEAAPVEAETEPETVETSEFVEAVSEPIPMPPKVIQESVPPEKISGTRIEPVAQGQPIPYQVPAFSTDSTVDEIIKLEPEPLPTSLPQEEAVGIGEVRRPFDTPSFVPQIISTEPVVQQPKTSAMMPQTTQPTTSPIRTAPMTGAGPQPASGMQTAVQLTFSFEIASLQLTPNFKMGALQLKPTSKIVTMRLAPSQQPQPAMNLQVTFEISLVQLAGNSIGMIRLTPSQQQRPSVISSPAFNIAGLQLLSGAETGAVQLTPSQQGQASVHVTARFQIATIEFSPSFEIASIVLNSTSKSVSVQLPGAGPSAVEGAPVFEITNVQLAGNGEIGMMHLNAQGLAPKPA